MNISIITVCYNSEKTIRDTIESVLSQKFEHIEYIVIDGGSTDRTMAIVREFGNRIAHVVSEPDNGIYDAMNKGIALATGDVIGILNSDDFYDADTAIASVVEAFNREPAADMVFGDVVFVLPEALQKVCRYYYAGHFKPRKLRYGWMPPHPATFVKRELYARYGLYNTSLKIAADYEMFVRWLLVNRCDYVWLSRVLVRMRMGGVSTSGIRSSILLSKEIVRACRSNGIYTNLLLVLSKLPFKLFELIRRPV
jgi:glycosyltransferase involved in cell wall biosynthesis